MRALLSLLLLLLSLSLATTNSLKEDIKGTTNDEQCTYTLFVQTGTPPNAGTSSVITLDLSGPDRRMSPLRIKNLSKWGQGICPDRSFFQVGNLDAFRGTRRCLSTPPCFMSLGTTATGDSPDWNVDYVDVIICRPNTATCDFQRFNVNNWLSIEDKPEIVDNCLPAGDGPKA